MPYSQNSTSMGAVSSVAAGSWTAPAARGANKSVAGPIITIAATSVTTGGTVTIEGRKNGTGGAGDVRELPRVAIAANSTVVVPVADIPELGTLCAEYRINVIARTDGTYTGAILTAA